MNGMSDIGRAETGDEGGLDPREAARLLVQTEQSAKRGLDFRSPLLSLLAAVVVLVAFGAGRSPTPTAAPLPVSVGAR